MPPSSRGSRPRTTCASEWRCRLFRLFLLARAEGWMSASMPTRPHASSRRWIHTTRRATASGDDADDRSCGGGTGYWEPPTTSPRHDLRLLFIDHYDSFTYNLVNIFAQLCERAPTVVAADSASSWEALTAMTTTTTASRAFDGIVLGPGPGGPSDYPLSLDVIRRANVPILGVCLGHQMLGQVHGGTVALAPTETHGQVWTIHLDQSSSLFGRLPSTIPATRYHSLHVTWDRHDPSGKLRETATTGDGVCMALEHSSLPHFGVQFHPESIGTEPNGRIVLENFCRICQQHRFPSRSGQVAQPRHEGVPAEAPDSPLVRTIESHEDASPDVPVAPLNVQRANMISPTACHPRDEVDCRSTTDVEVLIHKVRFSTADRPDPDCVMQNVLSQEPYSYWLDSSNHRQSPNSNNRVSILGATSSSSDTRGRRIEYYGEDFPEHERGVFVYACGPTGKEGNGVERFDTDILTYLGTQLPRTSTVITMVDEIRHDPEATGMSRVSVPPLPFSFRGGFVGYLGYEVRFDTERFLKEAEHGPTGRSRPLDSPETNDSRCKGTTRIPTAAFLWADRSFVYDHLGQDWYLVGVHSRADPEQRASTLRWMASSARHLRGLGSRNDHTSVVPIAKSIARVAFAPNRSRGTYNRNFDRCLELIRQGESYELCLTNQLEVTVGSDPSLTPLSLYRILRRQNPAPFAAFFNWNSERNKGLTSDAKILSGSLAIACSSPERFVSVKPNITLGSGALEVEAKPIKGTCARVQPANGRTRTLVEVEEDLRKARELQSSIKNRAENLMIVDLLRNDLSRVCETGSVGVVKLMDIESFATVHQMVSTIRGVIDPSRASSIDVLKACFPGGSMTGAPKQRTIDLLDELEEGVSRGPYSGCLGYVSLDGSMDMNIVIRSAVLTRANESDAWHVSIGAGGAITALSESDDEYGEMMLKASAVMSAVSEWASTAPSVDARSIRALANNSTGLFAGPAAHNLTACNR